MFNMLSYIGEKLNDANVVWGVGASLLLNKLGLIDKPNDLNPLPLQAMLRGRGFNLK